MIPWTELGGVHTGTCAGQVAEPQTPDNFIALPAAKGNDCTDNAYLISKLLSTVPKPQSSSTRHTAMLLSMVAVYCAMGDGNRKRPYPAFSSLHKARGPTLTPPSPVEVPKSRSLGRL